MPAKKKEPNLDELVYHYKAGKKELFPHILKHAKKHLGFLKGRYRVHDSFIDMAVAKVVKDAIETYQPSKGTRFTTHLINQAKKLDRDIRSVSHVSHVPDSVIRDWHKIQKVLEEEPDLSHREIAKRLKMKPERVKHVLDMFGSVEATHADFLMTEHHLPALDALEGMYHEQGEHHKLKVLQGMKELRTTNHYLLSKHLGLPLEHVQKHVQDIIADIRDINSLL